MAGGSPVLLLTQKLCVGQVCFPEQSGKVRVDSQAFCRSEWDQEVHPDLGTLKYTWLLQFRYRPKCGPQIKSQVLTQELTV